MKFIDDIGPKTATDDFEEVLNDFEMAYGVYVTIHDYSGMLLHANGKSLFPNRRYHLCPYCVKGRFTVPKWRGLCVRDCMIISDSVILRESRPFIKHCWKGVAELVVPIIRDKRIMSAAYVGAFKGKIPESTTLPKGYLDMHNRLPPIPDNDIIRRIKCAVTIFIQGMITTLESFIESEQDVDLNRKSQIFRFIQRYAHQKIKLADLAKHLCLSPSRAGHLTRVLFKRSFTELLTQERMLRAKTLLANDWLSIEHIAHASGYSNVYYFSTAFKQFYDVPPSQYRKHVQTLSDD